MRTTIATVLAICGAILFTAPSVANAAETIADKDTALQAPPASVWKTERSQIWPA